MCFFVSYLTTVPHIGCGHYKYSNDSIHSIRPRDTVDDVRYANQVLLYRSHLLLISVAPGRAKSQQSGKFAGRTALPGESAGVREAGRSHRRTILAQLHRRGGPGERQERATDNHHGARLRDQQLLGGLRRRRRRGNKK